MAGWLARQAAKRSIQHGALLPTTLALANMRSPARPGPARRSTHLLRAPHVPALVQLLEQGCQGSRVKEVEPLADGLHCRCLGGQAAHHLEQVLNSHLREGDALVVPQPLAAPHLRGRQGRAGRGRGAVKGLECRQAVRRRSSGSGG